MASIWLATGIHKDFFKHELLTSLVPDDDLSPKAFRDSQQVISVDISRTKFFGNPDDCKNHIAGWESFNTSNYCQGDMTGESLGEAFKLYLDPDRMNPTYSFLSFAYVKHNQELAGVVVYYVKNNPSKWVIALTPNTLKHSTEREVKVISSQTINLKSFGLVSESTLINLPELYENKKNSFVREINELTLAELFKEIITPTGKMDVEKLAVFSLLLQHPHKLNYPNNRELLTYFIANLKTALANPVLLNLAKLTFTTPISPRQLLRLLTVPEYYQTIQKRLLEAGSLAPVPHQLEVYFFLEEARLVSAANLDLLNEVLNNPKLIKLIRSGAFSPKHPFINTVFNDKQKFDCLKFIVNFPSDVAADILERISKLPEDHMVWTCVTQLMDVEECNSSANLDALITTLNYQENQVQVKLKSFFEAKLDTQSVLAKFSDQFATPEEAKLHKDLLKRYYQNPSDKIFRFNRPDSRLFRVINLTSQVNNIVSDSLAGEIQQNVAKAKNITSMMMDKKYGPAFINAMHEVEKGCNTIRAYLKLYNPAKYKEYLDFEAQYRQQVYIIISKHINRKDKSQSYLKAFRNELKNADSLIVGCLKKDQHKMVRIITASVINSICVICFPLLAFNFHHKLKTNSFWFNSTTRSHEMLERSHHKLVSALRGT